MKTVLVAWEDSNFTELARLLRRAVVHVSGNALTPKEAHHHIPSLPMGGDGGFKPFVSKGGDWSLVYAKGIDQYGSNPADELVCVVDGDKLHNHSIDGIERANLDADLAEWRKNTSKSWTLYLHSVAVHHEHVHGHVLTWNKESLVLGAISSDMPSDISGLLPDRKPWNQIAEECGDQAPTASDDYASRFRKPRECLESKVGILDAKQGATCDAILKAASKSSVVGVLQRCEDLRELAELVWQLLQSTTPAPD